MARRKGLEDSVVVRGLGSILMTHGQRTPRVYVLFHGFTDVPTQFEVVGKALFDDGANVYIPRLPHHGERVAPVRALGRVHGDELAAFGDSSVDIARALGDSVVVVGLSAGGVIAGWIAQTRSDVRRAVLIAPAIGAGRVSDDDALALVMIASRLPDVRRTNAPTDSTTPEYLQGISTTRFGRDTQARSPRSRGRRRQAARRQGHCVSPQRTRSNRERVGIARPRAALVRPRSGRLRIPISECDRTTTQHPGNQGARRES